ncbi:MAG: hypothetical protein JXA33_00420 [Anaerolineae bacterium]|nr:hypothetical protein [Anaerolineae bacterium]
MTPFIIWLNRLSALVAIPAVWGIFFSGAIIYLIAEWRLRFFALLAQYLFVGVLFMQIFETRPEIALLKILVGWLICGALFISARIREETIKERGIRLQWAANIPFRLLYLLTMTVIASLASQRYTLPFVSGDLALACFFLIVLAVLFLGTEEDDPVAVGVGMLNLLMSLDIFYSSQEPGLVVTGLMVMVSLLVGLASSYLTVVEVPE